MPGVPRLPTLTCRRMVTSSRPACPGTGRASLSHLAYFYDDERDYMSYLPAFAGTGLRSSEPVFVAVPGNKAGLLRERLGAESRLLRYGAMSETGRNPARLIPELRSFIDEHPGQPVRCICEVMWPGRSAAELCEAIRHEALINLAFDTATATIVCPYDVTGLAAGGLGGRAHPPGHPAERADPVATGYAGPGEVPAECDGPLPAPPADAEVLGYETNLRPIRQLVTGYAQPGRAGRRAGHRPRDRGQRAHREHAAAHRGAAARLQVWHTGEEILCQMQDQGWITDPLAGRVRRSPGPAGTRPVGGQPGVRPGRDEDQ